MSCLSITLRQSLIDGVCRVVAEIGTKWMARPLECYSAVRSHCRRDGAWSGDWTAVRREGADLRNSQQGDSSIARCFGAAADFDCRHACADDDTDRRAD